MHLFVKKHFSSSLLVELILQFAILLRKAVAFANINKLILIGISLDFIFYYFAIKFSENLHSNLNWLGFPEIYKPWVYIVPAFAQVLISSSFGAYKRNSLSVLKVFLSLLFGLVVITSLTFFLKQFAFSRVVVLLTYSFAILLFSLWRILLKLTFLKSDINNDSPKNTVLVGIDQKTINLALKLKSNVTSQYKIIGIIGLAIKDIGTKFENIKVIGSIENLKKVINEYKINNVIFSSENIGFDKIFSIVSYCQGENVNFLMSGSEHDYMVGKSNITHIDNVPLLKVQYNISMFAHKVIKRIFDVVVSFLLLLLVYPIGWLFKNIVKSKSAIVQLIMQIPKVFIGLKSFVGPKSHNYYEDLYLGKTGVTGLWALENFDETDVEENNRINLFYAKNQNIWLDLEILGRTIAKLFENLEK